MLSYFHNNQEAETSYVVVETSPALRRKSSVQLHLNTKKILLLVDPLKATFVGFSAAFWHFKYKIQLPHHKPKYK